MPGKVLNLRSITNPDQLGCRIAQFWMQWNTFRAPFVREMEEIRKYVYATDTTTTTNQKLPWKNKTTIPKLCQIRDNLNANYMETMFPSTKRSWLAWMANEQDSNSKDKRDAIIAYMNWATGQDRFRTEMSKLILDYIDWGNAFGTVEWIDERSTLTNPPTQVGYVGPAIRRISPTDIVFNPISPTFSEAPKIVRSLISWGELKKLLESQSTDEDAAEYQELYDYLKDIRSQVRNSVADLKVEDDYYQVDGFTSYRSYLESEYVEILTFYGDLFDWESEELLANHKIMVVDRHKVIAKKPNPSYFGYAPIFHCSWRPRQDNLWGMSPLANLVGMQYRIDHLENVKADALDLLIFPMLKIKGYVEDFTWEPMGRIYCGTEGDVELLTPPFQVLQANVEIQNYTATMEEMAGAPKEAMGFRSPGEKTAFEVSRMENAASRIFSNKIVQFEIQLEEPLLNGMLELSRRHIDSVVSFPIFDEDFKIQTFMSLTPQDITGAGRLKPMAARHFAQKSEMVQNITNFYASGPGQDPEIRQHFSSIQMAKLIENLINIEDWKIVQPYIRIPERADAQRLMNVVQEQVQMEAGAPSGLTPEDSDQPHTPQGIPGQQSPDATDQALGQGGPQLGGMGAQTQP